MYLSYAVSALCYYGKFANGPKFVFYIAIIFGVTSCIPAISFAVMMFNACIARSNLVDFILRSKCDMQFVGSLHLFLCEPVIF